ncbi:Hypothetical protein EMIHUDRAFT_439688, partial [Emiliania huxleyi CCMP1516]|uniref:Uncharacterized protein n=2 Tax=Emiliania huxleyi TaxID=2903 RepID=A0A0D3KXD1_EMIH1
SRRNRQDTWTTVTSSPLAHRSNSRNHGQGQRTEGHGLRPGDRDDEEREPQADQDGVHGQLPPRPRALLERQGVGRDGERRKDP